VALVWLDPAGRGGAGTVWLFGVPPDAPDEARRALDDWCRANDLDSAQVFSGVTIDLGAKEIHYREQADETTPGAYTEGPKTAWRIDRTAPLLAAPPEVLCRPPYGHSDAGHAALRTALATDPA
jgi:hypothetical protein